MFIIVLCIVVVAVAIGDGRCFLCLLAFSLCLNFDVDEMLFSLGDLGDLGDLAT